MAELNQELAQAAYDKYLPMAQALPADEIATYRLDLDLAIVNVNQSIHVIEMHRAAILEHLPKLDIAVLDDLPSLALATKMSALLAENSVPDDVSPREIIAEGWALRKTLMPVVASLAATGLIPSAVYERIARGRGPRDMAEDCVALSNVFTTYAAEVAGKHAADASTIERAAKVGSWLLQNLRTRNAPRPARQTSAEGDIRDRMETLLVTGYNQLRMIAYYFYGDDFGEHVAPLMSRHVPRKTAQTPDSTPETGDGSTPQTGDETGDETPAETASETAA